MRIRNLCIQNFRGIKTLNWAPDENSFFCLIGRGDSTKSTILEAIRRTFHPQWNLQFDDADFYDCLPQNTISIRVVLGDLVEDFLDLSSYGHWLCGWDSLQKRVCEDPGEGLEDALQVRLQVAESLEPSWAVTKHDDDSGIPFRPNDRSKVSVSLIGVLSDRHLTWSRGSILGRLTNTDDIPNSLADAGRAAKAAIELKRSEKLGTFDEAASAVEDTARKLGVRVSKAYNAHLDADAVNVRIGGLSLHDGGMPLRQLGIGSKRMLTVGMQQAALREPHITLFDEVEIGLEPHRIARLLSHLKDDQSGQYFVTTHSPVVLRELTVEDIQIVHCNNGEVSVVPAALPNLVDTIQGKIRSGADAFLAPKILVCEGPTEIGFARGLDDYWISKDKLSMAYQGVARFNAGGASEVKRTAESLKSLQYDVAVLADSDSEDNFSKEDSEELNKKGICSIVWEGETSTEERVFRDLPWAGVIGCLELAIQFDGNETRVLDQIRSKVDGDLFDSVYQSWTDSTELRIALGSAAKSSKWFKRVDKAEVLGRFVGPLLDSLYESSDLLKQINTLRNWIDDAGTGSSKSS